ncbi:hypothetical protein JCM11251_006339 [Rhodosporidiobolus azoricus]
MDTFGTRHEPLTSGNNDPSYAGFPSSPKRARLDLPSAHLNTADDCLKGEARKPKAAVIFAKDADKQPEELRGPEEQFVDQQLEVQDGADYYETLLVIQTAMNRLHHPTRHQIRMLLSLSLFPLLFKPPQKSANHSFSRRGVATGSSSSDAKTLASALLPSTDEPLSKSHRKLRELALGLLRDVIAASGTEVVCRAIRGSGRVETEREREERMKREETEAVKRKAEDEKLRAKKEGDRIKAEQNQQNGVKGKKVARFTASSSRKSESSTRRSNNGPDTDDEEDLAPLEADEALAISAKRIGQVEDLWDFLAGMTARKVRVRTRDKPILDEKGGVEGWEVLRVLVKGWAKEQERQEKEVALGDQPAPLSLLRYFKPSASSGFAREVSNKALDVVFWPFSEAAQPKKGEGENDEEISDEEMEENDRAGEADGGMRLQEKRTLAVELLGLIGQSSIDGYVSGAALVTEVVQRMKTLHTDSFAAFIETLATLPLPPAFLPRLLMSYLETHSHPLAATADILSLPPSSSTIAAASSSGSTSPRKRGLGSNASISSLRIRTSQGVPSFPGSPAKQRPEATFWQTPSPSSPDFLLLLARIPIEVPLDPPVSSLDSAAARRPKLLLPKTFARPQAAVEAFALVKAVLVSAAEEEVGEEKMDEWRDVLDKVQEKVDESKIKVEQHSR